MKTHINENKYEFIESANVRTKQVVLYLMSALIVDFSYYFWRDSNL